MEEAQRTFIPAAGHDWALPLYDPFVKLIGGDQARRTLLESASLRPGQVVLDLGCGTGSLAMLTKRDHPAVDVVGLDPDAKALARAKRKAMRAMASIQLDRGFADNLPYGDGRFDRVLSSFVFHHLRRDEKAGMLREARRVLKPGGLLCLLDFAGPESVSGPVARWLHGRSLLTDNEEHRVLTLMGQAGFHDRQAVGRGSMVFGLVAWSLFQAVAPTGEATS
jgi:ubiquinone/menaquinone biosynthesis C-methylase UbiE